MRALLNSPDLPEIEQPCGHAGLSCPRFSAMIAATSSPTSKGAKENEMRAKHCWLLLGSALAGLFLTVTVNAQATVEGISHNYEYEECHAPLKKSAMLAATKLGGSCDLTVLGVDDDSGFLRFDNALREALEAQDAAAVAALASFPLRLNLGDGSHVTLRDAVAFRQREASLLPPLRRAVDAAQPSELFCNDNGVMYGDGEIWANPVGSGSAAPFRITAINLPKGAALQGAPAAARLADATLSCSTSIHTAALCLTFYRFHR